MPDKDLLLLLKTIIQHIAVCEDRFNDINLPEDFISSRQGKILLESIAINLLAIGENVKKLSRKSYQTTLKYPDIKWDEIIRFRDLVSHHYEKLDYEVAFDICQVDLPQLKAAIQNELDNLNKDN